MVDSGETTDTGFFRRIADIARRGDQRRGFVAWIRLRLVVGFLVAFPLVVTLFFGRFFFEILDRWFRPISKQLFGFQVLGGGLILSLLALLLLGVIATNVFGGRLLTVFERRIARLPLLSPIYQGARQITEAIQIREQTEFRKVVLIRFPHAGVQSLGFVTREFGFATRFADEPTALVFVPTTPNPTSGFLVAVTQREIVTLDISVEEGVKLVISGGLLTPAALLHPVAGAKPTPGGPGHIPPST
jgi:uncharacterized membrane protein